MTVDESGGAKKNTRLHIALIRENPTFSFSKLRKTAYFAFNFHQPASWLLVRSLASAEIYNQTEQK